MSQIIKQQNEIFTKVFELIEFSKSHLANSVHELVLNDFSDMDFDYMINELDVSREQLARVKDEMNKLKTSVTGGSP